MISFTVYLIFALLVLVGALNWGAVGVFKVNPVKFINDNTFNSEYFERTIYILVGLAGLYMLFNRTFYLPFLGKTVIPPTAFREYQTNSPSARTFTLDGFETSDKYVLYWAAKEDPNKDMLVGPYEAYDDYSNYGVAPIINTKATVKVEMPQQYQVRKFGIMKTLPRHIHYRTINNTGILGEVKTYEVKE